MLSTYVSNEKAISVMGTTVVAGMLSLCFGNAETVEALEVASASKRFIFTCTSKSFIFKECLPPFSLSVCLSNASLMVVFLCSSASLMVVLSRYFVSLIKCCFFLFLH